MKPYLIILSILICITLGAAGDAFNSNGIQTWGHLFEALEILLLLLACLFQFKPRQVVIFIVAYAFFRFGFFDYLYNWIAGNELTYMGGENWWDLFFHKQMPSLIAISRVPFLIVGISITFRYLKE